MVNPGRVDDGIFGIGMLNEEYMHQPTTSEPFELQSSRKLLKHSAMHRSTRCPFSQLDVVYHKNWKSRTQKFRHPLLIQECNRGARLHDEKVQTIC